MVKLRVHTNGDAKHALDERFAVRIGSSAAYAQYLEGVVDEKPSSMCSARFDTGGLHAGPPLYTPSLKVQISRIKFYRPFRHWVVFMNMIIVK